MAEINTRLFGVLIIIVVLLFVGYLVIPEDEDKGMTTVHVIIDLGDHGELHRGNLTVWDGGSIVSSEAMSDNSTRYRFDNVVGDNQTVLDVLLRTAEWGNFTIEYTTHGSGKGSFVDSIAGVENGDLTWQYYINDEYGVLASDKKKVNDGDIIRWVYE